MSPQEPFHRLEALFHEIDALAAEPRAARLAALQRDDHELHRELCELLDMPTARVRDFDALQSAARALRGAASDAAAPDDPTHIGPYRLLRRLGEGGMGRVYLAEQSEPVQRTVALKLIRRGFDSAETRARFRIERQALAVLEHPNVARVYDAGSSEDGRPWFAMEYIEGVPITRWAEQRGLGLAQRIQLLLPVCEAVQHAHQKGLIHRDLKPSNILVVANGDIGQPRVIDFGIAKLVERPLDARSFATSFGELVGTPEYMSPEQAALGAVDIDTRADVYALGLVLHELLVGALPLAGVELRRLAFHEMCRRIREDETPRPSARPVIADSGSSGRWRQQLRGDLDAVLMKALAKDRERRYGSASALADDLRRYLAQQPVLAQPPSVGYRIGKFIRRHRVPVAATAMVLVALIAAGTVTGLSLLEERKALARAEWSLREAELRNDIANAYAESLLRLFGEGADVERLTAQLLQHAEVAGADWQTDPQTAALTAFAIGRHFLSRNDYVSARKAFEPWLQQDYGGDDLRSFGWTLLGFAYRYTYDKDKALEAFRRGQSLLHPNHVGTPGHASGLTQIALLSGEANDRVRAAAALEAVLATEVGGAQRMSTLNSLYQLEGTAGRFDAAHDAIRRAVNVIESNPMLMLPGRDTNRLILARMEFYHRGDTAAARRQLAAVRQNEAVAKGESRETAIALDLEGAMLRDEGRAAEALPLLEQAAALYARYTGENSTSVRRAQLELLLAMVDLGQLDQASLRLRAMQAIDSTDARLVLAEAWLALRQNGTDAATVVLQARDFDLDAADRVEQLRFHVQRLAAEGVSLRE